jgi:hypothetical protein
MRLGLLAQLLLAWKSSARPAQLSSAAACARAQAAVSTRAQAAAARVTRALRAGGVVVRTSECGTFDFANVGREACMRLELNSSYQGTSRASFLHASLPMCLFFTTKGEGNKGAPTADIGWLFTEPGALWQGPAWPQDSWAGTASSTVGPHFLGNVRRRCAAAVDRPSSNDTRAAALNYAIRRFKHFKLGRGCGGKPAASATRDECVCVCVNI